MSMCGNLLRVTVSELESYLRDSSLLEDRIYDDENEDPQLVDIDKSWAGILFLLTGQGLENLDHKLARVFFSGQVIDEQQDLGYGPGHYLNPEQVAEVHDEIARMSRDDLKNQFDPVKMNELDIYPSIWEEGDVAFDYLANYFSILQEVFATATRNREAIITFLN